MHNSSALHAYHYMCFVYAKQILPENDDCVMAVVRDVRLMSMGIFFRTKSNQY